MGASSTRRGAIGVVGSLLLHGGGALALAWFPTSQPPQRPPVATPVVVELVEFQPGLSGADTTAPPGGVKLNPSPAPSGEKPEGPLPVRRGPRRKRAAPTEGPAPNPLSRAKPGALSLGGLRSEGKRAAPQGVPPPALVEPPADRPRTPTRTPDDRGQGAPSLRSLGFVPASGGRAVRDDLSLPVVVTIQPDGRIEFRHRKIGTLKYYTLKNRIQKETFALRLAMARRWARKQMKTRLAALRGELRTAWSRPVAAHQRRRVLFELWDDCHEDLQENAAAESALDRERARIGMRARALILDFVVRELPQSSPLAYTRNELQRLNRRRASRARFEPYAASR